MSKPRDSPRQHSSERELADLIRPHLDGIYGRAYALIGSVPDAEDLTQEVCIRACN